MSWNLGSSGGSEVAKERTGARPYRSVRSRARHPVGIRSQDSHDDRGDVGLPCSKLGCLSLFLSLDLIGDSQHRGRDDPGHLLLQEMAGLCLGNRRLGNVLLHAR